MSHFYQKEARHSIEAIEGEGRVYDTVVAQFLEHLFERMENADVEQDSREKIEQLIAEIQTKSFAYIQTRIDFQQAVDQVKQRGTSAQDQLIEVDRRRRFAHNALLDSIQIASRNVFQVTRDQGAMPNEFRSLLDQNQADYRNVVADAVIDYVWQILDQIDWESRFAKSAK